jgi:antitoxin (DNA-binding transcriptional repressor) of toxin-antitoxin stability system
MEKMTITALRQNLFNVSDHVLATGESVEIERHGKHLLLVPEQGAGRLARLTLISRQRQPPLCRGISQRANPGEIEQIV